MKHEERSAVLCVGRIYCDLIFTGLDRMPVLGREVFADALTIAAGGGAFISAAHFVDVGRPAALVGRLGHDALSVAIEGQLAESGIDLSFLERAEDAGPQLTVASVIGSERAFLTRRAGPAEPATLEAALSWSHARHLHIAEYATLAEMPDLVSRAKAAGLSVSLDPSWDDALIGDPALVANSRGIDLFLPNLEEAREITGESDPAAMLAALGAHFPNVVIKAGGEGAFALCGGERLRQEAEPVPVVDTTGAGDAFNAGFVDGWLEGADPAASLAAAIRAGSRAVQTAGGAVRQVG
ncbi:carbohydrate kinase family protein [Martelella endophytica]|uniref:Ribokinase n=1 Tax=Martelella endophytica TaxID=1486262 RepID=A0A0D5LWK1_MAREN|nr:PfkB family carbohydrate kinase [Martelella endophytica]AJY48325.1 ribokinase [Martelella endophytica]